MTPLRTLWWLLEHAAYILGAWTGLAVVVGLGVGASIARRDRQHPAEPMGWYCAVCGAPFEHGRPLVAHLLAEHPDACPSTGEFGSVTQ